MNFRFNATCVISILNFALFIAPFVSNAQWSTNGTSIYNTNTGNVGIGTSSPGSLLEVKKGIDMGTTGSQFVAPYNIGTCNDFGAGGADQYLILIPYVSQATGNPSAGLSGRIYAYRGTSTTGNISLEYQVAMQTAWSATVADFIPITSSSNVVNLYKVDYNGATYVAVHVPDIIANAQSSVSINFQGFFWNNINTQKPLLVLTTSLSNIGKIRDYQPVFGKSIFATSAGNVGIGTSDTKDYKLAVNGSAIFTKAVVKPYTNWPDYVFDKSFSLTSLDSLESFISVYKHLPGMASAMDVENNGLDLAENQKVLLENTEKLTLYIIQQNKTIELLQNQISNLKKSLSEIKNDLEVLKK